MATKQQQKGGDGFTSHVAGMSKNQLYDIMSQMKTLIEQNQQQARQILIDNPSLTKSLFQAQIMLGMVRPPQVMPNIKQAMSQQPQQPAQTGPKLNIPTPQPMPADSGGHGQASSSQPQLPIRQQFQPPASHPPLPFQSQAIPSNAVPSSQQARGHVPTISPPLNSQVHNLPPPPPHATQQPPFQSHLPGVSNQMQHSTQSTVMMHQPLQPPLPPHARPPSLQPFSQQMHSQAPHNLGFQPSNAPPQHLSQSMFHSGANLPVSFQQGQPPLPAQPPPQHLYQASPHIGSDFSTTGAAPMHLDRVAPWVPGLPDNVGSGSQLTGPPPQPLMTSGQGSQPSRPPQLPPEIEKSLLQQVMSLTPEQINLLPPEQRQQVLQLQQMLR